MVLSFIRLNKFFPLLCLLLMSSGLTLSYASEQNINLQLLDKSSYQQILQANKGKPFLLVLWSIDCPPCYEELELLGRYKRTNPSLKMVFISTDAVSDSDTVQQVLLENNLQDQDQWIFSDAPAHQLRYSIDPHWYGELPRSYLFSKTHGRKALSGKLDIDTLVFSFPVF